MAQWIRHLTTDQGIPGSSPGRVVFFSSSEQQILSGKLSDALIHPNFSFIAEILSSDQSPQAVTE